MSIDTPSASPALDPAYDDTPTGETTTDAHVGASSIPIHLAPGFDLKPTRLSHDVDLLALHGELDTMAGRALLAYASKLVAGEVTGVVIDARRIAFAGVRGVMSFIAGIESLSERGIQHRVAGLCPAVRHAFSVTGSLGRLSECRTVDAAVAELLYWPVTSKTRASGGRGCDAHAQPQAV